MEYFKSEILYKFLFLYHFQPHLVIMDEKEQVYPMRQEYDNFNIRRFLTYYEDGKLEPFLSHSEL